MKNFTNHVLIWCIERIKNSYSKGESASRKLPLKEREWERERERERESRVKFLTPYLCDYRKAINIQLCVS